MTSSKWTCTKTVSMASDLGQPYLCRLGLENFCPVVREAPSAAEIDSNADVTIILCSSCWHVLLLRFLSGSVGHAKFQRGILEHGCVSIHEILRRYQRRLGP